MDKDEYKSYIEEALKKAYTLEDNVYNEVVSTLKSKGVEIMLSIKMSDYSYKLVDSFGSTCPLLFGVLVLWKQNDRSRVYYYSNLLFSCKRLMENKLFSKVYLKLLSPTEHPLREDYILYYPAWRNKVLSFILGNCLEKRQLLEDKR